MNAIHVFGPRLVSLIGTLVLVLLSTAATAQKIRIDSVDHRRFKEENVLRFFVDLLERDGTPVSDVVDEEFTFSIGDEPVPGIVKTSAFFDTSEQAAITIVLAAHGDYLAPLEGETTPFDYAVDGMARFVSEMRPDVSFPVVLYRPSIPKGFGLHPRGPRHGG